MAPLKLRPTRLKKAVKKMKIDAAAIIRQGERKVTSAQKALSKKRGDKTLRARLRKNRALLAKAKVLNAGLLRSEKLANSMCPLQVAYLDFHFE